MDGAGSVRIFFQIVVPLSAPVLATVSIFGFLWSWMDYMNPLIFLNSPAKYPLSVGLNWFRLQPTSPGEPKEHLLMAAALLMVLPCVTLFFSMQRQFVQGVTLTGIKGGGV